MFTPHSLGLALLMMIASAVFWGSWANTYKGARNYRFELFYWDYAIGIFLISVILALTMGNTGNEPSSFLNNIRTVDSQNIVMAMTGMAMIGGAIFNLANLLQVAGIDMIGIAVAFPLSIGIALVVGVVSSFALQPKGNPTLLAIGVLCAVVAVVLDGKAYGSLAGGGKSASKKGMVVCIVSGVLMGLWAPFMARAMTYSRHGDVLRDALSPYCAAVFLTLGALLSCFVWNVYFMKKPLIGEPVGFAGFFSTSLSNHLLGLFGGILWGVAMVFNLVAASLTGVAISYAIGQSAPMIATLWGVFIWKEFAHSPAKAKLYLAGMFVFYCLAITFVAKAY